LNKNYPEQRPGAFNHSDLRLDAATLADVACYQKTVCSGGDGFRQVTIMNVDAVLEAVRALPHENAGAAFGALSRHAEAQRNKEDGWQTDAEDRLNWRKRRELAFTYGNTTVPVAEPAPTIKQIELKAC
jgi:hypothetical protein